MQSDLLGQTIGGRYRIIAVLGSGGMGKVYRAQDEVLKRDVAIKVVRSGLFVPGAEERFLREGQALAQLHHPNILPIYDLFTHEGSILLVMYFVKGTSVEAILHEGPLDLKQAERIVRQAAAALDDAHAHGIIHRDVKPANMLIGESGELLLTDFGIAKLERDQRITQTGQTIGSLYYMPPEAIRGEDVDARSDIYSLAVSTYEIVTGKRPFDAESDYDVMTRHVKGDHARADTVKASVPKALADALERGLALRPEDRFATAGEFAAAAFATDDSIAVGSWSAAPTQPFAIPAPPPPSRTVSRPIAGKSLAPYAAGLLAAGLLIPVFGFLSGGKLAGWAAVVGIAAAGLAATMFWLSRQRVVSAPEPVPQKVDSFKPEKSATVIRPAAVPPAPPMQPTPARATPGEFTQRVPSPSDTAEVFRPSPPLSSSPGEFTKMFQNPVPAPSPAPPPPLPPAGDQDFPATQMFPTARSSPPVNAPPPTFAEPPVSNAPPAADDLFEATRIYSVGSGGAAPAPQPRPDVALVVSSCTDPAYLGRRQGVSRIPFRIGRASEESDFALSFDVALSRAHAELDFRDGSYIVRDLGSANGTFVNGRRLSSTEEPLFYGSRILLGSNTELVFTANDVEEIPDLSGQTIERRFKLAQKIHSSSKSAVYKAEDLRLNSVVVVKLLSPRLAGHPGYRDQFKREAQIASALTFPNICRVIDYGETTIGTVPPRPSVFICLDYMEGGSLLSRVTAGEKVEPQRIAEWLEKIATALDRIHQQGVVHGGIKPSSIVFDSHDEPYLTDFALASTHSEGQRRAVTGSAGFLAPEQWDGEFPTARSDQYSFAVLAYLLTTGALPHVGQDNREVRAFNFLRGAVPAHEMAVRTGHTPVPAAVSAILTRAMSTAPTDRFPSAGDFAKAFRLALNAVVARKQISVFISYRRATCSAWALLLKRELERGNGFEVFVDTEQRDNAGRFPEKLQKNIERCDVFVCLLTKNTLQSDWVNQEIACASGKHKPMIPVMREFDVPRDMTKFAAPVQELMSYDGIKLYPEWVDAAVDRLAKSIRQSVNADSRGAAASEG